jgi:hypothetical protein
VANLEPLSRVDFEGAQAMKLFEHPDFKQAIIRPADHLRPRGLLESRIADTLP